MRDDGQRVWWVACGLLFAAAFGTNVPTPLLLIYRDTLDLSPTVLTAIFGVYALGLAPSLLLGGPASDRLGRVRVLLPLTVLVGAASLLFLLGSQSLAVLFVARFVQGLASGAVFSVGSAWLQDLAGPARASTAARRASIAQTGGFCLGPLTSGLLAGYGPAPLTLPYLVHAALVAVALAGALAVVGLGTPGPGARDGAGWLPRPRLTVPGRRLFARVTVPTAICVYAFPSVAVTVLPLLLADRSSLVVFTGVLSAATLGTGTLVQPFAHRLGTRCGPVGAGLGALGYAVGIVSGFAQAVPLTFLAGVLLGAGGGLCLNAGLVLVARVSTPATRGACNGLFYTWAYVGFAAPLLTTSFVDVTELATPLAVLVALSAATSVWLAVRSRDRVV
ncbi:putative MFS family arabinose efflux permease [Pseudonocardia sediminis]|uniref:Putative MFS family arabinose efflux permease n=1 Tax=Pseudonocardia sediminis TaxID=1397368 RepID=A0A4Q7UR80_PSEST|nr:MFS transporter [Pseudonocardia sediminis]RZT84205.1 putative MFS family arabinose efflux permease [Pseudonocardia sediminis]